VSDKRVGLVHRKHVITLSITSGDNPVMTWQAQRSGAEATDLCRPWSTFAANLNQAAASRNRPPTVILSAMPHEMEHENQRGCPKRLGGSRESCLTDRHCPMELGTLFDAEQHLPAH
jgi:hypothetical protein